VLADIAAVLPAVALSTYGTDAFSLKALQMKGMSSPHASAFFISCSAGASATTGADFHDLLT
jgi:hypothetical protein